MSGEHYISQQLQGQRDGIADCNKRIAEFQDRGGSLTGDLASARKLQVKVANFKADYERIERESVDDLGRLSVKLPDIMSLNVNASVLDSIVSTLVLQKASVEAECDDDVEGSTAAKRKAHIERIVELQAALDAPNKKYQEYNESLRIWEQRAAEIEGDGTKGESVGGLAFELNYIGSELPKEIARVKVRRREVASLIHSRIAAMGDVYTELFGPVQEVIANSLLMRNGFSLTFESMIVDRRFQADLFERYISQGNAGSFYGKDKGGALLDELRSNIEFGNVEDVLALVESVVEHLQVDMRTSQKSKVGILNQLKKGVELRDLYNFLWSFGYLEPEYSLKMDGKDLSHLSPGERGTLLLIFYLLVDKSTRPIVVDQPEENLDSQTVFRVLIPIIEDVKRRRQIIMVTHSPNIAVVCDAEQIIHSNIDRGLGNQVIYETGSIESPAINRYLVDVLEGTRPAFDNRDLKYYS